MSKFYQIIRFSTQTPFTNKDWFLHIHFRLGCCPCPILWGLDMDKWLHAKGPMTIQSNIIPVKLPWIFPGAPLIFSGASGNIQGNVDKYLQHDMILKIALHWIKPGLYSMRAYTRVYSRIRRLSAQLSPVAPSAYADCRRQSSNMLNFQGQRRPAQAFQPITKALQGHRGPTRCSA